MFLSAPRPPVSLVWLPGVFWHSEDSSADGRDKNRTHGGNEGQGQPVCAEPIKEANRYRLRAQHHLHTVTVPVLFPW